MLPSHTTQAIVLDDDPINRVAMKRILGKCGCEVHEFDSVEGVVSHIENHQIDIVFSDMRLPNAPGGEDLLNIVFELKLSVPIIMMSSAMNTQMRSHLMAKGAAACIQKPLSRHICEQLLNDMREPPESPSESQN